MTYNNLYYQFGNKSMNEEKMTIVQRVEENGIEFTKQMNNHMILYLVNFILICSAFVFMVNYIIE